MNIFGYRLIACAVAGVLDQIFADPGGHMHPICLIGNLIGWTERHTRPLFPKTKNGERAGGAYLVAFVVLVVVAAVCAVTLGAYRIHPVCGVVAESVLTFYALAEKSLERESYAVYAALEEEGLDGARHAVSMIVGRDTAGLSETGVVKAAVETVAENTSDGVVAPMLFAFLGGAPCAYFYKAVNTMDSMVGYRNEKYRYYGTVAARLDDALNFVPARLSAVFMIAALVPVQIIAGFFRAGKIRQAGDRQERDVRERFQARWMQGIGREFQAREMQRIGRKLQVHSRRSVLEELRKRKLRDVVRIYRMYRKCHASPNSAQTESVMAGALGVELAGPASYFGVLHDKPVIGEKTREVQRADIVRSIAVLRAASGLFWLCGLLVLAVLWLTV